MKKVLSCFVITTLLFSFAFTVSAQASSVKYVDNRFLKNYVAYVGGAKFDVDCGLGGFTYWQKQIDEGIWTGKKRPEPLMGDANIDGKVDAKDALFALNFSINGNIQTATIASGVKTSFHIRWDREFMDLYNQGSLSDWENSPEHWLHYCWYNSPVFADVTKDCVVNALDALQILKYSVGKAKNFPEGDFTSISGRFMYYPWATEYYPELFNDLFVFITEEEFCEKYRFEYDVTPTDS